MITVTEWAYFTRNHPYCWTIASGIGLAFIVGGLIVRVWAIAEIGVYFDNRVHIQKDHQLIETGHYRYVRHGSYTGVYVLAMEIAVYVSAWIGLVVSALVLGWAGRTATALSGKSKRSFTTLATPTGSTCAKPVCSSPSYSKPQVG
ncbi:methyltransferase family protein [Persicitalea jodogahamensis]